MSPSNSSPIYDLKLNSMVAMEEKSTTNNPQQGSPQEVVPQGTITDVASGRTFPEWLNCGQRVIRPENGTMQTYPPNDNIAFLCNICKREFPTANSLFAHQRAHKHDHELGRELKKREASNSLEQGVSKRPSYSYQGSSNSVDLGGHSPDTSSNDKHLGVSRDPSEVIKGDGSITVPPLNSYDVTVAYPVAPYGNTSYGLSSGPLLVTHNNNNVALVSKRENTNHPTFSDSNPLGLSLGPSKPRGGGSSSDFPSLLNDETTMAPPATPYRSFTENTSNGSSSRDLLPSYSYSPHDVSLELSLCSSNDIGSCSNNNNNNNDSSSQGLLSLELSLGPSNNISHYPSLNGGVIRGGLTNLNMPLPPRWYHFHNYNPLDSTTSNVPLSPPPPPPSTTNPPNE